MFALPRFQVNLLLERYSFVPLSGLPKGFYSHRSLFASKGTFFNLPYKPARKAITKFLPNATSPELYGR